ncbi:hypothetical protein FPV67DRAFT_310045 [Lyophyllum atratum]|nr:hypothetical protein FPV67DRAFT_310045 [Lyophyllum atratum]
MTLRLLLPLITSLLGVALWSGCGINSDKDDRQAPKASKANMYSTRFHNIRQRNIFTTSPYQIFVHGIVSSSTRRTPFSNHRKLCRTQVGSEKLVRQHNVQDRSHSVSHLARR